MPLRLYIGNDNVIVLDNLQNSVTGAYDNGATVTVEIVDAISNTVQTGSPRPTLSSVTESPNQGKYRATLTGLTLSKNRAYKATVYVTGSGGETGEFVCDISPETRCV